MFRFDPYSPAVDADPFPYYKTLRDEHPCFWSEDANMWVLSRYADIVNALFYADNCNMVYGDAAAVLTSMIEAVRGVVTKAAA